MGVISIGEFKADTLVALARVAAGETLDITNDGQVFAEVRPKKINKMDDPVFRAAYERLMNSFERPIRGLKGPATYEERTER